MDDVDGNLTSEIVVILNEYENHENQLGIYNVTLEVIDSENHVAHLLIVIEVCDVTDPVIEGLQDIEIALNRDTYNFLEGITVTDNYDGDLTDEITIDSSDVDFNSYGTYQVQYYIADTSGNYVLESIEVTVKDMQPPVFNGISTIIKRSEEVYLVSDIVSTFQVYDNLQGNLIDDIYIIEDFYTGFGDIPGNYYIIYGVKDLFDNETLHRVDIIVSDLIPQSSLYIDEHEIVVPNDYLLTDIDFINLLKYTENIDTTKTYAVTFTSKIYFRDYQIPGTYPTTVKIVSPSGIYFEKDIIIRVLPKIDYTFIEPEPPWYSPENLLDLPMWITIPSGLVILGAILYLGTRKSGVKK